MSLLSQQGAHESPREGSHAKRNTQSTHPLPTALPSWVSWSFLSEDPNTQQLLSTQELRWSSSYLNSKIVLSPSSKGEGLPESQEWWPQPTTLLFEGTKDLSQLSSFTTCLASQALDVSLAWKTIGGDWKETRATPGVDTEPSFHRTIKAIGSLFSGFSPTALEFVREWSSHLPKYLFQKFRKEKQIAGTTRS